jgi:hypothetical protein
MNAWDMEGRIMAIFSNFPEVLRKMTKSLGWPRIQHGRNGSAVRWPFAELIRVEHLKLQDGSQPHNVVMNLRVP